MKKKYIIFVFLALFQVLFPALSLGQSSSVNYLKTETMLSSTGANRQTSIQYYDKKGRPSQLLSNGVGSSGWLRTYTEYDVWGRMSKSSAPFLSSGPDYKSSYSLSSESANTYSGDTYGWTTYTYDALDRETSALGPGTEWFDDQRDVSHAFQINSSNSVRRYEAPLGNAKTLVTPGTYYPAGELQATVQEDEDFKCEVTYINRLGQIVLERRGSSDEIADTYYVYDDFGHVRFILSPQYQVAGSKSTMAYEYQYDERGRVVRKILPGSEYVEFWYDTANRLLFMQDATLREQGLYRFYLYDNLSRLCVQGTCTNCDRSSYRDDVRYDSSSSGVAGTGYVHTRSWLVTNPEIEVVNYYGSYSCLDGQLYSTCPVKPFLSQMGVLSANGSQLGVSVDAEHLHGLLTGKVIRLSDGRLLYCCLYYDYRGRPVRTNEVYSTGRTVSTVFQLSFTGKPQQVLTVVGDCGRVFSTLEKNSYDTVGDKLIQTTLSVNGSADKVVSHTSYDGVGRISSQYHGTSSLSSSYTYNIRGWQKTISSPGFEEELLYGNMEVMEGVPLYNGSIPNMTWRGADGVRHCYAFSYDDQNRLEYGAYETEGWNLTDDDRYSLYVDGYDLNGNITSLRRYGRKDDGDYGLVDDLTFSYVGNQLTHVNDAALAVNTAGSTDFKDILSASAMVEYNYNGVGSLVSDVNKGITNITYDNLNHPRHISFASTSSSSSGGNAIDYVYSPDGTKLQVVHIVNGASTVLSGSSLHSFACDTTDYVGSLILHNGDLEKVLFCGGYVTFSGGSPNAPVFHYYSTDHLGNIRSVYTDSGAIEQSIAYDPFGMIIPDLSMNLSFQPYLYNGKELDRTHGLDWYDYGARYYDASLCRWPSMDPLCEKYCHVSPYAYCMGNPVNLIDYEGMDPGDFFRTINEAAIDFGLYYNDNSIRENLEYGSSIIKVLNQNGEFGYTYTVANRGKSGNVNCSEAPWGYETVADIHTHGHSSENDPVSYFDNDFSGMPRDKQMHIDNRVNLRNVKNNMDIGNANKNNLDSFLVTPNGSLKKYSPQTGKVILISTGMPSDFNDSNCLNYNSSLKETKPINLYIEFQQMLKILSYGKSVLFKK